MIHLKMLLFFTFVLYVSAITVNVPFCTDGLKPNIAPFHFTTSGIEQPSTKALICHDQQSLHIRWFCEDAEIVSTYKNCNDPLFNEDAVEFFISSPDSYPSKYFEFEVSPAGKLFIADITNNNMNCSNMGTVYYPCTSAIYAGEVTHNGWNGYLKVGILCFYLDLKFVGRGKMIKEFKGNLFRIDKYKTQGNPTRYLAFNPGMNSPACFHQPLKFVDFKLV